MEVQIVDLSPDSKTRKAKSSLLSKIIVAFVATLLIGNVAVFSFLIGRSTKEKPLPEVSNISMHMNTPKALGDETETTPTITPEPTVSNSNNSSTSTSPTPTPKTNELTIYSIPELDGFRTSSGIGSSQSAIQIGRNNDMVARGFLTFDLTRIPNNARIINAKIEMFVASKEGFPERMGALMVDHLIYGDTLNSSDYSSVAMLSSFTELEARLTDRDWLSADVTNAVVNDIDSVRPRSQFRIHYENEVKSNYEDFLFIESGENYLGSGYVPRLILTYR